MLPFFYTHYKKAPLATLVSFLSAACLLVALCYSLGYLFDLFGIRDEVSLRDSLSIAVLFGVLWFVLKKLAAKIADRKRAKQGEDAAPGAGAARSAAERPAAEAGGPAPAPGGMSLDELLALAARYGDAGDYRQQLTILREAAAQYPDVPGVYNLMGIAHRVQGNYTEAVECYRKASGLDPENGVFMTNTAVALMSDERSEEALGWFERGLPLLKRSNSGAYPSALGNYALALGKIGHAENAVRCLKEAASLGYSNAEEIRKRLEELGICYH